MEAYRDKHKGADIYVIASGKSVDYVPLSFFEGKITIGVNQVYKKIVPTYLLRKESELLEDILKLGLPTTHFVSRGRGGGPNRINAAMISKMGNPANVVVFAHIPNTCTRPSFPPKPNQLIVSFSTITSAIHLAAHMGAKNIILVGHDGGTLDGACNFDGYHTDATYRIAWRRRGEADYRKWITKIDGDTLEVRRMLEERYGCNVLSLNPFINFGLEGHVYAR